MFLWKSEHARWQGKYEAGRWWRIVSWVIYLLGLPPWIVIFIVHRNWIAAALETSGAPAMIVGLVFALRGDEREPNVWLKRLMYSWIPAGVFMSIYDFGGFYTLSQILESLLVLGYLAGTSLLALERARGYLWYVLMHVACGWLMWHQGLYGLFALQVISLLFIVDAYRLWRSTHA